MSRLRLDAIRRAAARPPGERLARRRRRADRRDEPDARPADARLCPHSTRCPRQLATECSICLGATATLVEASAEHHRAQQPTRANGGTEPRAFGRAAKPPEGHVALSVAAASVQVSQTTVWHWAKQRKVSSVREGKRLWIREADLELILEDRLRVLRETAYAKVPPTSFRRARNRAPKEIA